MLILDRRHKSFLILLKFLSLLITYCILFSQLSIVSASQPAFLKEAELKSSGFTSYERINPNLLVYPLKRIYENIKLELLPSEEQKREYLYQLFEVRFKELVYIVNNKKEGFIFFTADRYNTFVGKIKKDYAPDFNKRLRFQDYLKILERLRDRYSSNSPYWEKIQQTIDTTRSLI